MECPKTPFIPLCTYTKSSQKLEREIALIQSHCFALMSKHRNEFIRPPLSLCKNARPEFRFLTRIAFPVSCYFLIKLCCVKQAKRLAVVGIDILVLNISIDNEVRGKLRCSLFNSSFSKP